MSIAKTTVLGKSTCFRIYMTCCLFISPVLCLLLFLLIGMCEDEAPIGCRTSRALRGWRHPSFIYEASLPFCGRSCARVYVGVKRKSGKRWRVARFPPLSTLHICTLVTPSSSPGLQCQKARRALSHVDACHQTGRCQCLL